MGKPGSPPTPSGAEPGFSREMIKNQLAAVLASSEFAGRAVLRKFLSYVVEKDLAGRSHEIKEYTIATEVFGRSESFDGVKDSIVRMQAGRLRRALERYYASNGALDPIRIEIPKGTYVPVFLRPSTTRPGNVNTCQEPAHTTFITPSGPKVAVMPLLNLTGDQSQEYFCDGLTEELSQELARYQGIRVVASHSTLHLKGQKTGAIELGHKLGARFIVEGAMRRDAGFLKFSVRLIDTMDGLQIWGEQYRRELKADSLIVMQEDIARRVAGILGDLFGVISTQLSREYHKKPVENLTTYDAFLRFHQYERSLSPESLAGAYSALERAVKDDPESGLAWSLLSNLHAHFCVFGIEHPRGNPTLDEAAAMSRKGVSLEPANQLVRALNAQIFLMTGQKDAFLREAEIAYDLNPNNPTIVGLIGWMRALYGDWEYGLGLMEKAIELNPFFPGWYQVVPFLHFYRQRMYPEALHRAQVFNMPQLFWDPALRLAALGKMGLIDDARPVIAELLRLKPDFPIRGRHLCGFFVKESDLVDEFFDGLNRAGLGI